MRIASWILLSIAGGLILSGSLASAYVAYGWGPDEIGSVGLSELAGGREEVERGLRARRGTAAAFAASFAVLFLIVVLVPYRRGEVWSWWAILVSTAVLALLILMRVPLLETRSGAATGWMVAAVVLVGLLLDARRLKRH